MKISGYFHDDKASRLYETTVRTWILDERIIGEIEWTPVLRLLLGRHGDWKQHPLIKSIFAACDGSTRRLGDWVGNSSGEVNRVDACKGNPACRSGGGSGGRRRRGQRRGEAARSAAQATARARGLARPVRGGSRPRQAPLGARTLPTCAAQTYQPIGPLRPRECRAA